MCVRIYNLGDVILSSDVFAGVKKQPADKRLFGAKMFCMKTVTVFVCLRDCQWHLFVGIF